MNQGSVNRAGHSRWLDWRAPSGCCSTAGAEIFCESCSNHIAFFISDVAKVLEDGGFPDSKLGMTKSRSSLAKVRPDALVHPGFASNFDVKSFVY